ncbi:ImmA/IrrE family metallo-endopeptidase [Lacibacter sp.]|uniref:ImmA/IrrE family metallo-endopeptidase n=1 Tax=Lacibacter sp. TaxID=1915409 RepID=UPI002B4AD213|nr:ImmA/IrrE family metallo-endopeptidase [Lacibacter sp.]HLP37588.1 ImmA/IrrE family metallo-endopeptidase [Lacibacter sp.]
MIAPLRKKIISDAAHNVASQFYQSNATDLAAIAKFEGLNFYHDHYEDTFDGMLLYDEKDFHIHINIDRGNGSLTKRGNFTFAHELGHYFIDEHRIGLQTGKIEAHGSIHEVNQKNIIEYEADYFASCLLMPEQRFRSFSGGRGKNFSLDTIINLSNAFQTSILATVIRFAEVGTHEMTAVISKNNIVSWFAQSKDFPKWSFRFKVGQQLPPATVAGEFFTRTESKYTSVEDVDPDNWFYANDKRANRTMHEQCYYSDSYGYVISLIWFD